jgi:glycosyltransferase involved in cell wall biosynthesis
MKANLSIIVPTIGRQTLSETLKSILKQVSPDDEVLVIADGEQPDAERIAKPFGGRVTYLEYGPTRDFGHSQRNYAMGIAKNGYLAFMDDDDVYVDGALGTIKEAIEANADRPLMFRMHFLDKIIWRRPVLEIGNVSTQMFIVPNARERLAKWESHHVGDFVFFWNTLELWPAGALIWREEIIARLEQQNMGRK